MTQVSGAPRRGLSLARLTVLDAALPELVTVAAAVGFRKAGIRLSATPSVGVPPYDMLGDAPMMRETLRCSRRNCNMIDASIRQAS
jgi:hypothetical protein